MKQIVLLIILFLNTNFLRSQLNGDFENWTNYGTYQDPDYWQTYNFLSSFFPGFPISAFKVSGVDKHSGNYALKITSVKFPFKLIPQFPDSFGVVFNGKISIGPPKLFVGSPYTGRPERLQFYTKYLPLAKDTALASVTLFRYLPTGRDTIARGRVKILPSGVYSLYEVLLNYRSNANPDSAYVLFSVSASDSNTRRVGSALYIDDVLFTGYVGIKNYLDYKSKIFVFPNPVVDALSINAQTDDAATTEILDVYGNLINSYKFCDYYVIINTQNYSNGCYFYRILDKKNQQLINGKFMVVK